MCPTTMLARAGLLLCFVVGTRQLSITELKVPAAVEAGEDAELQCRYERGGVPESVLIVKWWWKSLNTTEEKLVQLYQRMGNQRGETMRHNIKIKDNDTIVLLNATPSDSGLYQCDVSFIISSVQPEESRKDKELDVFTKGSGPNLTITEVDDGPDEDTEEDVLIECKAEDVAPAPDIVLKVNGEEINMIEYLTGPDSFGFYDIIGNTTLSKHAVSGMAVHCELFYLNVNISHPPYIDEQVYNPSGALDPTDAPQNVTEPDATSNSLQNPSGDSCQCCFSWTLLIFLGLLMQLPALF